MSQGGRDADGYVVQPVAVRDLTLRDGTRMALRWMHHGDERRRVKYLGICPRALGKDSDVV